jgi:hypothetical protein
LILASLTEDLLAETGLAFTALALLECSRLQAIIWPLLGDFSFLRIDRAVGVCIINVYCAFLGDGFYVGLVPQPDISGD